MTSHKLARIATLMVDRSGFGIRFSLRRPIHNITELPSKPAVVEWIKKSIRHRLVHPGKRHKVIVENAAYLLGNTCYFSKGAKR